MPTSEQETKVCPVFVVANRSEDQQSAEALTAVITDLWGRLPISDLMSEMLMARESGATDTELDELLTTALDSWRALDWPQWKP